MTLKLLKILLRNFENYKALLDDVLGPLLFMRILIEFSEHLYVI